MFILGYNKKDKKQNFSTLDIVEPQNKEIVKFGNVSILPIIWPKIIPPTACKTKIQGGFD